MSRANWTPGAASLATQRTVDVEILYLDQTTCTRCQGTDASLKTALAVVQPQLDALGLTAALRSTRVTSAEQAQQLDMVTSPTVRINGRDIAPELKESTCGPCSDLCGETTACRVWTYQGQEFTEPPAELILAAIVRELSAEVAEAALPDAPSAVPDNLRRFFAGRAESGADTCCTDAEQATCCAVEEKAACCEASGTGHCGCR
ncbi:MAG TPA: DUF2703 domain-containing protein [Chloroflexota bacterium]|jgi:hypothetical protein